MTLELASGNQRLDLLAIGLGSGVDRIEDACAQMLLADGSLPAQAMLIAAAARPSVCLGEKIRANADTLSVAFRQLLIHGTPTQAIAALDAIELTETLEPVPVVIELLRANVPQPVLDRAENLLRSMAWKLHELTEHGSEKRLHPTLAALAARYRLPIIEALSRALELEVDHLELQKANVRELFIECLMIIGPDDAPEVRRVLWSSNPSVREIVRHLMMSGTHPGILRSIIGSLGHNYPHPRALDAVQERDDPEFVVSLLMTISKPISQKLMQNLRQISSINWLSRESLDLSWIPGEYQAGIIHLINLTRLSRDCRRNVEEWLLRYGCSEAREVAVQSASQHDGDKVKEIVRSSLNSADSAVAAWACSQLKTQQFPDAARLLLEKLRCADREVREVARAELLEWFHAERMLEMQEAMTPEIGRHAGRLLLEIDDSALTTIELELNHAIRHRRIRALMAIDRMELIHETQAFLFKMLTDIDPLVRRTLVDILAKLPSLDSLLALQYLTRDESLRVREAAVVAFQRLKGSMGELNLASQLSNHAETAERPVSSTDDSGILAWANPADETRSIN